MVALAGVATLLPALEDMSLCPAVVCFVAWTHETKPESPTSRGSSSPSSFGRCHSSLTSAPSILPEPTFAPLRDPGEPPVQPLCPFSSYGHRKSPRRHARAPEELAVPRPLSCAPAPAALWPCPYPSMSVCAHAPHRPWPRSVCEPLWPAHALSPPPSRCCSPTAASACWLRPPLPHAATPRCVAVSTHCCNFSTAA
nr:extensin-like [Aegilops tauschii subsp. strangulata]